MKENQSSVEKAAWDYSLSNESFGDPKVEVPAFRAGYYRALEDAVNVLLDYSDAAGEVTEGRGIVATVRGLGV